MDNNLPYLAAAYGAWWLVITIYCVHLARELQRVRQAVDDLKLQDRGQALSILNRLHRGSDERFRRDNVFRTF